MVEHLAVNQTVVGSNPTEGANFWMYARADEGIGL